MWACERTLMAQIGEDFSVYPRSVAVIHGVPGAVVRRAPEKFLFLSSVVPGFVGQRHRGGFLCPLSPENAQALLHGHPAFKPSRCREGQSFGFGDRLGLATPGHIQALDNSRVFPVLAQQSMRENARTGRTFAQVLADAVFGALQEGYTAGFGADADHLKNIDQAQEAARLGYTFFTCDPSDLLTPTNSLSECEVSEYKKTMPWPSLKDGYLGQTFTVSKFGELRFTEDDLLRTSIKYWRALDFAERMHNALSSMIPEGFDFELSVDETGEPTTPLEHLFLALECKRRGLKLAGLAPCFSGEMEKAVDFRGDLQKFREELRAHIAIARSFGPYKISLHSGSDKFSLYPVIAEEAQDLWHVKTAGTSYLVALEVVARVHPPLFREILRLARTRFSEERKRYQISAQVERVPEPEQLADSELVRLFSDPDVRQVLHVTYGAVLREFFADLRATLLVHEEGYHAALVHHFRRHLRALGVMEDA